MKVDGGLGMGFSPNIAEIAQEAKSQEDPLRFPYFLERRTDDFPTFWNVE